MSVEKLPSVVIDNGSGCIKAGFANGDYPSYEFPSIVGRPRALGLLGIFLGKDKLCGHEASSKRGLLTLRYPIEHGIVTNWDSMESLWHHTFYEVLCVNPEEHSLLITEMPLNPRANREKMTQIMFETFNIPFLYSCPSPLLALLGSGRDTGLVIDSGEGVTHTVPVYRGLTLTRAVLRMDIGGRDVTDYLTRILCERGYTFSTSAERLEVCNIKERLGFVSTDYDHALGLSGTWSEFERHFELPDGASVTVGNERFRCIEPVFSPSLLGKSMASLQDMAYASVMKCDTDIRARLYRNIVLSGGNMAFTGMRERMLKEISKLAPKGSKVEVTAPHYTRYLSWRGGSLLAGSSQFESMCIRRLEDYEELGPNIVHRKCI